MAGNSSDWPVHQLWPLSQGKQRTEFDVLFFHGLQLTENGAVNAWRSTWTQRGNDDICWPEEWLPFDLGQAVRIFSISYNAHVVTSPYDDVSEIAHNLFENLMDRRHEWYYPIVLIGHSFGGLVLKSLVVKLKRESTIRNPTNCLSQRKVQCAKIFLKNIKGVAFYAVPHAGCNNIVKYVSKLINCTNRNYCGIIENMQPWKRNMEELSVDFDDIANESKMNIYAFCEGRATKQLGILVDFSSAQRIARYNVYMVEDADHIDVCKPPSKAHPSYRLLLQLINICQEVEKETDQTLENAVPQRKSNLDVNCSEKKREQLVTNFHNLDRGKEKVTHSYSTFIGYTPLQRD